MTPGHAGPGSAPGARFLLSACTVLRKAARTEPCMGGRGEGRGWWLEVGPGWRRNRDRENRSPPGTSVRLHLRPAASDPTQGWEAIQTSLRAHCPLVLAAEQRQGAPFHVAAVGSDRGSRPDPQTPSCPYRPSSAQGTGCRVERSCARCLQQSPCLGHFCFLLTPSTMPAGTCEESKVLGE